MTYKLEYTAEAVSGLATMPKADARRLVAKLGALARDPFNAAGVKKLTGQDGYRVRAGDWRAVYLLDRGKLVVVVVKIGNRRDVYKRR